MYTNVTYVHICTVHVHVHTLLVYWLYLASHDDIAHKNLFSSIFS